MVDGKVWMLFLAGLLLLSPMASSATPRGALETGYSFGGQELSSLAIDPTGAYGVATVAFDPTKISLPGQAARHDVYHCAFDSVTCRGMRHDVATGPAGAAQIADAVAFIQSGGITARYAIAGPGAYVSFWSNLRETPIWTRALANGETVTDVVVDPVSGSRVVAAVAPTSGIGSGRIVVWDSTGSLLWHYNVTDASGSSSNVRPTSLAFARAGGLAAVGTNRGILFVTPTNPSAPALAADTHPIETGNLAVAEVLMARSGNALLARTSAGVYFVPIVDGRPSSLVWSRNLPDTVSAIALSEDGKHFAVAAGKKVYFYRGVEGTLVAQPLGDAYEAPANVADLDYDATGSLLVAVANKHVLGFGQGRTSPIWSFDASLPQFGALEAPLRAVAVSDDAERIVVAGSKGLMPYRTSATASIFTVGSSTIQVTPGTPVTVSFDLTNTGSVPDNYTFVVTRPIGWAGTTPGSIVLLPDETRRVNLTVDPPLGQPPGREGVRVEVRSKVLADAGRVGTDACGRLHAIVACGLVNLTVPRSIQLTVETAETTVVVPAGLESPVALQVRNTGNAEGVVNLSAIQSVSRGTSWPVRFTEDRLVIPPGGHVSTVMIIAAPPGGASGDRSIVTVRAREGAIEATTVFTAYIDPQFAVDVSIGAKSLGFRPGQLRSLVVNITNVGNTDDRFNVTALITPRGAESDWRITMDREQIDIPRGGTRSITLTLRPAVAEPQEASLGVRAVSVGSRDTQEDTVFLALLMEPDRPPVKNRWTPAPAGFALVALAAAAFAFRRFGRPPA